MKYHMFNYINDVRVSTSESMKLRPCFQALIHRFKSLLPYVCLLPFLLQNYEPPFTIHITRILTSLRRTSAPIQLTIVLGVLGTQDTSCILIAGLFEREYIQPLSPVNSIKLGLLT